MKENEELIMQNMVRYIKRTARQLKEEKNEKILLDFLCEVFFDKTHKCCNELFGNLIVRAGCTEANVMEYDTTELQKRVQEEIHLSNYEPT